MFDQELQFWSVENLVSKPDKAEAISTFQQLLFKLSVDPPGFQKLAETLVEGRPGLLECILSAGKLSLSNFSRRLNAHT